jgi:hypothetical protein
MLQDHLLLVTFIVVFYILKVLFFQIGSTEWVEENIADLHSKVVSYLNVDCAVQGACLFAGSTPQLDKLLVDVTRHVGRVFCSHASVWCRDFGQKLQFSFS